MIFRISKEKFWDNSSGIERWPEMLKKLPRYIEVSDKNKIAEEYFGFKKDDKGRLNGAYEVYGLFGGELKNDEVVITGCNLVKKSGNGYELSEEAVRLVEEYKNSGRWEITLTEQILKYSLRGRAIFTALINGGKLHFKDGYLKGMSKAHLEFNGEKYFIFSDKADVKNLNDLMWLYPDRTVGSFWVKEFSIDNSQPIVVEGITGKEPSINSVSTLIKIPFVLFEYLGWVKEIEIGVYGLAKEKVKQELSKDIFDGFVLKDIRSDIEILKEIVKEYSDFRGFFPVSFVGEKLKDKIDPENEMSYEKWTDRYFMTGFNENRFKLLSYEQGQPRHGVGLLGRKDYQLMKIEFIE